MGIPLAPQSNLLAYARISFTTQNPFHLLLAKHIRSNGEGDTVFDVSTASLDALFRKAKMRANIEDLHFHDTRREALTRLSKIFDVMELARISGHRDLRILQNVYYAPSVRDLSAKLD